MSNLIRCFHNEFLTLCWRSERNRILPSVLELKNRLQESTIIYRSLASLAQHAEQFAHRLAQFDKLNITDKHYHLSCYCFGLSRLFQIKQKPANSFLLLHRAFDLFFQYLGLEGGLIIDSTQGLRYANDPNGEMLVTLMNTERFLTDNGRLVRNRSRFEFIRQLNAERNAMLYIHGASAPFLKIVSEKIKIGAEIIRDLEGNNRWGTIANQLFATPILDEAAIFDAIEDIDTYFEEVTVP